ncbi:MAG: sigma-54-dependent Fis family transcriptional regulator, partial [Bacteroidetes bacterium]|nr:sigma-54-dependent Fis family transcriptional regulator [Bacteroidota bacterium]
FGHEKGAFTGATERRKGRFELADGGTIFLDEVGDLPLELQAKLLRVLQEGSFTRLGGSETMHVEVRVIAATNRDLEEAVTDGAFREDLYYRLNVFPIRLPPLRERPGDIPLLVRHLVQKHSARLGKDVEVIPQQAMEQLQTYGWPGNVRELENVIERALILTSGTTLQLDAALGAARSPRRDAPDASLALEDVQRRHIRRVLELTDGQIAGEDGAAVRLGLHPSTLRSRMKKLGIERP